jgi:hypothetical protein
MQEKSCKTCNNNKNNSCKIKNQTIEGDASQQGCGDWEEKEVETN